MAMYASSRRSALLSVPIIARIVVRPWSEPEDLTQPELTAQVGGVSTALFSCNGLLTHYIQPLYDSLSLWYPHMARYFTRRHLCACQCQLRSLQPQPSPGLVFLSHRENSKNWATEYAKEVSLFRAQKYNQIYARKPEPMAHMGTYSSSEAVCAQVSGPTCSGSGLLNGGGLFLSSRRINASE